MNEARCKDCKHAQWERTPTGRIKKNIPGRCALKRLEDTPQYLCVVKQRLHVVCIWPDYAGRCDGFEAEGGAS